MGAGWKVIPHTADVALRAWGDTMEEMFVAAVTGMFSQAWDRRTVIPRSVWEVSASGRDAASLLVNLLNEFLYRHECERVLWRGVESITFVAEEQDWRVLARVRGETITHRHRLRRELKAATLHGLEVKPTRNGFSVQVIFDV
ncbi:MAG TPA: archease [Firmicutes bacterium]|nr:archease [Bacillota bacterium]